MPLESALVTGPAERPLHATLERLGLTASDAVRLVREAVGQA